MEENLLSTVERKNNKFYKNLTAQAINNRPNTTDSDCKNWKYQRINTIFV